MSLAQDVINKSIEHHSKFNLEAAKKATDSVKSNEDQDIEKKLI